MSGRIACVNCVDAVLSYTCRMQCVSLYVFMRCRAVQKIAEPIEKQEMTEDLLVQGMLYYMRVQIVLREGAIPGTTAGLLRKEVSLPLHRQFNANILYYYY